MAGHSKWANTKHRKAGQDAKRAKIFNKLGREITVAAKSGMPDPEHNPALRNAIATARAASMPNDRIKKAIEAATNKAGEGADFSAIRYEGYGPGGVAVIVEALTDNKNRTAAEVRAAFTKSGGNLGETGSVGFMFEHVGSVIFEKSVSSEDEIFEKAVEAGAENVEVDSEDYEVITSVGDFISVKEALVADLGDPKEGGLIWKPNNTQELDADKAEKLFKMIDVLEDSDDVQKVFTNAEISDDILANM